jgi:hypothetical protein
VTQAARFTRLNPGLFCPILSRGQLWQGISRTNTAIARTDIGGLGSNAALRKAGRLPQRLGSR